MLQNIPKPVYIDNLSQLYDILGEWILATPIEFDRYNIRCFLDNGKETIVVTFYVPSISGFSIIIGMPAKAIPSSVRPADMYYLFMSIIQDVINKNIAQNPFMPAIAIQGDIRAKQDKYRFLDLDL